MKIPRGWWIWASLGLCATLVFGAMTWFTRSVLATESERAAAEARADLQERMRLALWRMDSLGAAILLSESQRPVGGTDSRLPVKIRFGIENGRLSSDLEPARLDELKQRFSPDGNLPKALRLIARLPENEPEPAPPSRKNSYTSQNRYRQEDQNLANSVEKSIRTKAVDATLNTGRDQAIASAPADVIKDMEAQSSYKFAPQEPAPQAGQPRVAWVNDGLFLIRQIFTAGDDRYEGAWIDLDALKKILLAEVADLLPESALLPATAATDDGLVLASFPFRLDVGMIPPVPLEIRRDTTISLAAGWFAALLAMATAALLIRGVMRLSERRASFVSAVTHELRTPLTTFRLYSEMLESGAVKEEKRGQYLRVLTREADRLAHLVENVLAFSRIEKGSVRSVMAVTTVAGLLEPMRERLDARLESAGMSLEMDTAAQHQPVRVDAAAVEHILFNLIDNAAKYGLGDPPVVTIRVAIGREIEIHVCDHGPGIPAHERRRIFRAFHKSAHAAAESRPGVGLGLALSRRLASEMGGSLRYEPREKGACFILRLPGRQG